MQKPSEYGDIHWLDDEQYQKATGQLRLQLNGLMSVFHGYGQDVFIPEVINEIIKMTEDFGLKVRGVDKPIALSRSFRIDR